MQKPIDKFIPYFFVLFFLVIFTVDFFLVKIAINAQTGLVTDRAYETGLNYNKNLEAFEKQINLKWKGSLRLSEEQKLKNKILFKLLDKQENPIDNGEVIARIIRPIGNFQPDETPLEYNEKTQLYESEYIFKFEGVWEIKIFAKRNENEFQMNQRFIVKK